MSKTILPPAHDTIPSPPPLRLADLRDENSHRSAEVSNVRDPSFDGFNGHLSIAPTFGTLEDLVTSTDLMPAAFHDTVIGAGQGRPKDAAPKGPVHYQRPGTVPPGNPYETLDEHLADAATELVHDFPSLSEAVTLARNILLANHFIAPTKESGS